MIIIPLMDTNASWLQCPQTYIYGGMGSGKTLLLKGMMNYCDAEGISYEHYDAEGTLSMFNVYLTYEDQYIAFACQLIGKVLPDFRNDIYGWMKEDPDTYKHHMDMDLYLKNINILKEVIQMSGTGYMHILCMVLKIIMSPTSDYYFLDHPGRSLHPHVERLMMFIMMSICPYTKVVMTTYSQEIAEYKDPVAFKLTGTERQVILLTMGSKPIFKVI